jgi:hypothetical protein
MFPIPIQPYFGELAWILWPDIYKSLANYEAFVASTQGDELRDQVPHAIRVLHDDHGPSVPFPSIAKGIGIPIGSVTSYVCMCA